MNDITLPPPAGLMDCGQGFVEVWTASQIKAAVIAERERCARLCERVVNEAELGRGHAKGAAMCIELIRGKA